jgi:hypothetical protein
MRELALRKTVEAAIMAARSPESGIELGRPLNAADCLVFAERARGVTFLYCLLLIAWTGSLGPVFAETASPSPLQQNADSPPVSGTVTEHNAVSTDAATKPGNSSSPKSAKLDSESPVTELIKNIQAAVQALAIIVAGIWAYFKFIKGRVFKARLEPSIDGTVINRTNTHM